MKINHYPIASGSLGTQIVCRTAGALFVRLEECLDLLH